MLTFRLLLGSGIGIATLLAGVVAPAYAADPPPRRIIFAVDACDGPTFNAQFGAGVCVRNSGVPLNLFLSQLARLHFAPGWLFAPGLVNANTTDPIQVRNIGGEVHTFTEVEKFGGGFVPELNAILGLTQVSECGSAPNMPAPPSDENHTVLAGGSFTFIEGDAGTHLYQCCIHPWMKAVLTIRPARGPAPS